ncbi:MAG: hypothetical protein ACLFUF_03970, partial [Opitutales bacterium]
ARRHFRGFSCIETCSFLILDVTAQEPELRFLSNCLSSSGLLGFHQPPTPFVRQHKRHFS